jgi:sugar lactone lactonase YvrE
VTETTRTRSFTLRVSQFPSQALPHTLDWRPRDCPMPWGRPGAQRVSLTALCLALMVCVRFVAFGADVMYVANWSNTIEEFTPDGGRSVFASAGLSIPTAIAFDRAGNLYAANFSGNTIERFTPGGIGTVFASTGLNGPYGLAFDSVGNLYAANAYGNTVERFTPGGVGSVFAATGLNRPQGIAIDKADNVYVVSSASQSIEKFTPGGVGSVFAKSVLSNGVYSLNDPLGMAIDSKGNLYVANGVGASIEKFTPAGEASLFAYTGTTTPFGMGVDSEDNVYSANYFVNTVTRFTPDGVGAVVASGLNEPTSIAFRPIPVPGLPGFFVYGIIAFAVRASARGRRPKVAPQSWGDCTAGEA